jgi:Fe-Mn family superoxide dismutase
MLFEVPPLPYPKDALEPAMSRNTLEFHYEKHHKGYMAKLKAAIENTPEAEMSLIDVIKGAKGDVFNNAAQVFNHSFFWECMQPDGGGPPPAGPVLDLITRDFGDWTKFRTKFIQTGMKRFGSGYVWLVWQDGTSKLMSTANADTPVKTGIKPLLTADVWEHAYYLDYQNKRDGFLESFCDKLINWSFVQRQLQM